MIERAEVVAILDEARQGRYDALHILLGRFVPRNHPDRTDILTDSLLAIADKLNRGEPSVLLAPQLAGFVKNYRRRVEAREHKQTEALIVVGDDQLERFRPTESSDPADIFETHERVADKINALVKMKESEPRQFAILMARHQGIPDSEYFKSLGEDLTPDALRQLRARTKKTVTKAMQEIRKASES